MFNRDTAELIKATLMLHTIRDDLGRLDFQPPCSLSLAQQFGDRWVLNTEPIQE